MLTCLLMMCFLKHPLVLVFILWDIRFTNLFLKFYLGNSYIMVFPVLLQEDVYVYPTRKHLVILPLLRLKKNKNHDRTVSAASAWFEGFSVHHILFTVSLRGQFEHAEIIVFTTNQSFIKQLKNFCTYTIKVYLYYSHT